VAAFACVLRYVRICNVFASRSLHFADDVIARRKLLRTIMAAQACRTGGLGMVKLVCGPRREIRIGVAAFARIRSSHMAGSRCVSFALGIWPAAIVTGHAIAKDTNVIEGNTRGPGHKIAGIMAIRAII
jgi:hypothetical protein